jgi:hypothetical protein
MKMVISFFSGVVICGLLLIGVSNVLPIRAETEDLTEESTDSDVAGLLPDVETIYHEALTKPFEKAESKIYDEDIAEFYGELIDSCGLRNTADAVN